MKLAPAIDPALAQPATGVDWIPLLVSLVVVLAVALFYFLGRGRVSAEARWGLLLGLRGLLGKEVRSRSRGWRPAWLLTGYLGLLALAVTGFMALLERAGGVVSPAIGTQLFSALAVGTVLLMAFITPALTVGAVAGERERRTLELLLVTRASALGLVSGKLLGSLLYILFLLTAALPAYALVFLFGGVPPLYLAMTLAVAAVTALAHAALGLLLSALLKRTLVASVVAYLLVLFMVFGLPFVSVVATVAPMVRGGASPDVAVPPGYLSVSPLSSVGSVLPSGSSGGMPLVGDLIPMFFGLGRYGYGGQLPAASSGSLLTTTYVVHINPLTGQVETAARWAPWVYHFLFSAALVLCSLLLSALALAPIKPWQSFRHRRRVELRGGG